MPLIFRGQPRAFSMIFMLEIWERFGFYTVQGILTLYFVRALGYSETKAYFTFGAFSALVYGMVALGGYLGDKVIGIKRSIVLGLITLSAGYLGLAMANEAQVFLALGLVCVGNGLFKANPSNLLSKCYSENDARLHSAFTLYYMAINLGSIVALFAGPFLSSRYGYPYAYFLSFLGLLMGLANYMFQRHQIRHIHTLADQKRITLWQWLFLATGIVILTYLSSYLLQHAQVARGLVWVITVLVLGIYFYCMRGKTRQAILRMLVALVLMIEAVVFFTLYQQMPTSLNLFAVNNVHPFLLNIPLDPQSFQALNPIWIILMSPVLAKIYQRLNQRGWNFSIPYKFSAGMFCCGVSFMLLFFARFFHDEAGLVSGWWLVASYFFQSSGELFVSALGVAMVAELVPAGITGFVMGMWFLTSSIAGFVGASVASLTALPEQVVPGVVSLMVYTKVFAEIGIVTLLIAALMWGTSKYLSQHY